MHPTGPRDGRRGHLPCLALAVVALVFGLLAGLRLPNLWSVTHLLFDYDFGLTRRSLVGEALSLFDTAFSYRSLALVSLGVFATWVALLFRYTAFAAGFSEGAWLVLAGYLASGGFVFLAHSVGYLDHLGLLICLACLLLPASPAGMALRTVLCIVMVFSHEGLFLFAFPIVFFDALLRTMLQPPERRRTLLALQVVLAGAIAGATFYTGSAAIDASLEGAVRTHLESKAKDFDPRPDSVQVLFNRSADNLNVMWASWQDPLTVKRFFHAVALIVPYVAAMFLLMIRTTRHLVHERRLRWMILGLAFGCSLAPLSVALLAWDFYRFSTQVQTASTLILLSLCAAGARAELRCEFGKPLVVLLVAAVFLNATANLKLFDGREVRRPPFGDVAAAASKVLSREAELFAVPER